MKKVKILVAFMGLLSLCYPLGAQEARFSGRWVLNHDKTRIMDLPDITIDISQAEGIIRYRKTVKDSQNERLTEMALSADGKEGSYTDFRGNRLKCSAAFHDGILTLTYQSRQRRSGQWVILDIKEEHFLSADRKTLSIAHEEHWEGQGGKWPNPMVFDRLAENAGKVQGAKKNAY